MNVTHLNTTVVDPVRVSLRGFFVSISSVLASLSLTSLILIILFRNLEPIKGRRVFAAVATLVLLVLDIERVTFNELWVTNQFMLIRSTVDLIFLVLVFFVLCFLCMQYIVRQWLNSNKRLSGLDDQSEREQIFTLQAAVVRVRVAKIISSNITFLILFVILFVEQAGLGSMFFYYYGAQYGVYPAFVNWLGYANGIVHGAIFFVFIFIAFLADVINDIRKHGVCKGYYSRDPLNYRVDFIFIASVLLFVILYSVMALIPYSYATDVLGTIFNFLFRFSLILASGLSCHIVIIKRFITKLLSKKTVDEKTLSRSDLMLRVLSHPKGKELFEAYCTSELSIENVKAYYDLKTYQELTQKEKKEYMCRVIYYKYVQSNALMEVNMANSTRTALKSAIETLDSQNLDTIFDELIIEIRSNLTDTFTRFQVTEGYRKFKRRSSFATKEVTELKIITPVDTTQPEDPPSPSNPATPVSPLPSTDDSTTPQSAAPLIPQENIFL